MRVIVGFYRQSMNLRESYLRGVYKWVACGITEGHGAFQVLSLHQSLGKGGLGGSWTADSGDGDRMGEQIYATIARTPSSAAPPGVGVFLGR